MKKTNKKAVSLLVAISIFICLCASACKGGNSPAAHVHAVTKMVEEVPATCTQAGVKKSTAIATNAAFWSLKTATNSSPRPKQTL